jgi:hypothetical protein
LQNARRCAFCGGKPLLNGDNLKLTFNETGKSILNINGMTFNAGGLGLGTLTAGTDFLDSFSANGVIAKLSTASTGWLQVKLPGACRRLPGSAWLRSLGYFLGGRCYLCVK